MQSQLTESQRKILEKQQYRLVGSHCAVKVCGWTKNKIGGRGACYKEKFYGIKSHQCLQMTSSMFCANRCKFCWRGLKAPVSKDWYGDIDDVGFIVDEAIKKHVKLLQGFKGYEKADKKLVSEMGDVRHVALSLTGEPITYPKINELLEEFHKKKISTFLVTNGQYPEQIEKIKNITQLYISLDASNEQMMKEIDRPLFDDYWERLLKSLDIMGGKEFRTAIRLTLIKGENMGGIFDYAELIKRASPDFIEVKSYMWVGESQKQYNVEHMPFIEDIREFSKSLLGFLPDYELGGEHLGSRVVLLVKRGVERIIKFE